MSNAALGFTNYVKTGTVAATDALPLFPITNLQNDSGAAADGWQTAGTTGIVVTIMAPQTQVTWHALGLFRTNLTSAATLTFSLFTNPSTLVWTSSTFGPMGGSGQVVMWTGGVVADYALVVINDAGNPDGHINAPLAFAGPAWVPLSNLSLQTVYGRDKTTDEVVSRGGQEYPVLRFQRRRWNLNMQGVRTASELWPQLDVMMRQANQGGNVLGIPDFTSASMGYEALFGRLAQSADVAYPLGTADRRSWTGQLTERL